jgi:hypothetical protein
MDNNDILYNLSRDYSKLYDLLKKEYQIASYVSIEVKGIISKKYSQLVVLQYEITTNYFCFDIILFSPENKKEFTKVCEEYNIRYFPLQNNPPNN